MPAASGLAAVCDVLVAAEGMHFCLSEAKLGLLPATIGPYVMRALGEQASRRYFITAERFSAAEAHALGLRARGLAAADALDAKVDAIVAALVANGPRRGQGLQELVQDLAGQPITAELRADTARRIADIRASDEGKRRRAGVSRQARAGWLGRRRRGDTQWTSTPRISIAHCAAALGWASGLRLYAVRVPDRPGRLPGLGDLPSGLQVLQHPVVLGASRPDAGRRVLRRQDPGRRFAVGRGAHLHPHPGRRGARGRACSAPTPTVLDHGRALMGGTLAATRMSPRPPRARRPTRRPSRSRTSRLSLLGDAAVPAMLWLAWAHPVLFFAGLAIALLLMGVLIVVLFRFLRALLRRFKERRLLSSPATP